MADIVPVTPSASYTVWAEDFASSGVLQRVKVVLGAPDVDGGNVAATNPMPVTGAVGVSGAVSVSAMPAVSISVSAVLGTVVTVLGTQVVSVVPGVSVNALVTGVVSISVMPAVSGTVTVIAPAVSTIVTLLGTVAVNVVAGGAAPGTTAATQSAISAQVVWLAPTQTLSVVSTIATLLGTVAVNVVAGGAGGGSVTTAAPSISATGQVVWVAGGQSTTASPVYVNVLNAFSVSGTLSLSNIAVVTTAASVSVSGLPVWLSPTQGVNALVSGVVSVSAMPAISISVSAALGTVITILGTQVVSVVPGVSVNALVTGPVSISAMPAISISVSAVLGTVITVLGTQVVTVALLNFTTATPTVTATGPIFWLANTVTVTVTATVTGSLIISGIAVVTTAASVSVSGLPVWLNPTQQVVVSGLVGHAVSISGITPSSTPPVSGTLGLPVWPGIPAHNAMMIVVTSTAIAQSAAVYVFTIWTGAVGAPAAAGTTAIAVPAGKTLRVQAVQAIVNSSAVTGGTVNAILLAVGATGSLVSASISTQFQVAKLQVLVSAGPVSAGVLGIEADVGAGTTIGVILVASTAAVLQQLAILGYLF